MPATFGTRFIALHDRPLKAADDTILFRGKDMETDRPVAIRVLCADTAEEPACIERFRRRAARTGRRCLPIIELRCDESECYAVTPWPAGVSADDALRGRDGRRGRWVHPTIAAVAALAIAAGLIVDAETLYRWLEKSPVASVDAWPVALWSWAAAPGPLAGVAGGLLVATVAGALVFVTIRRRSGGALRWRIGSVGIATLLAGAGVAVAARAVPRLEARHFGDVGRWCAQQWLASPLTLRQALVAAAVVTVILVVAVRLKRPAFWLPRVASSLAVLLAVAIVVVPMLGGAGGLPATIDLRPLGPDVRLPSPPSASTPDPQSPSADTQTGGREGGSSPGAATATARAATVGTGKTSDRATRFFKGPSASTGSTMRAVRSGCVCPGEVVVVRETTTEPETTDVDIEYPAVEDEYEEDFGDDTETFDDASSVSETTTSSSSSSSLSNSSSSSSSSSSTSCEYTTVDGHTTGGCTGG